ncbi:hypothetical protein PUN28_006347 [Cardiocondyla obscurior]|uniref:Secreted protein n=1 Tax=Cardiocondyla obscurior TaxID=286306 RepID=A0AAW2GB60_9HYME
MDRVIFVIFVLCKTYVALYVVLHTYMHIHTCKQKGRLQQLACLNLRFDGMSGYLSKLDGFNRPISGDRVS